MSEKLDQIRYKFYLTGYVLLLGIITAVILWLLSHVQALVIMLVASILLAYLLFPVVNFMGNPIKIEIPESITILKRKLRLFKSKKSLNVREKGFSRIISILLVYVLLFMIVLVLTSFVFPKVAQEFNEFVYNIPTFADKAEEWVHGFNERLEPYFPGQAKNIIPNAIQKFTDEIETYTYTAVTYTFTFVRQIFSTLLAIVIIPVFTFYILLDLERLKAAFQACIPDNRKDEIMGLMRAIDNVIGRYIRGQIVVSLFVAVAISIALIFMKINYALLIGIISGAVNFIPYLGVVISFVPAAIIAYVNHSFLWALLVIAVLVIIQQVEGQVVSPSVMGEAVGLPPIVIIIAIIIGGQLMGLLGMLIAIPVAAIARAAVIYYYNLNAEKSARAIAV